MDLTAAADELYGVVPEEFVETRKRLAAEAKVAGDRDLSRRIGALRRPAASAWAVNQLARSAPDELGWLADVGAELRAEWAAGRHVGGLDQRRGELIDLLGRTARTLAKEAGRPLREPAAREVEETLLAATMDPVVADEVRSGRLTQPRSHVGFVPAGAPATPAQDAVQGAVQDAVQGTVQGAVQGAGRGAATAPPGGRHGQDGKSDTERAGADTVGAVRADRERKDREDADRKRERLLERARAADAEAREADNLFAARVSEAEAAERAHAELTDEAERLRWRLDDVLERGDAALKRLRAARRERDRAAGRAEDARRRADEAHGGLPAG